MSLQTDRPVSPDEPGTGADGEWSDAELTALALAADPDTPVAPDAVPFGSDRSWGLPTSYFPPAARTARPLSAAAGRIRSAAALTVIAAFLMITALGFCATYGVLVHA